MHPSSELSDCFISDNENEKLVNHIMTGTCYIRDNITNNFSHGVKLQSLISFSQIYIKYWNLEIDSMEHMFFYVL
jgi:hypothetical protein